MTDTGLCLQDLVGGGGQGQAGSAGATNANNSGSGANHNDHLHNHSSIHDSVAAAVSVSSAITGLMSGGAGTGPLGHLHHHGGHDLSGHHHHHHHHMGPHTPSLHEPLEKLKSKLKDERVKGVEVSWFISQSINIPGQISDDKQPEQCDYRAITTPGDFSGYTRVASEWKRRTRKKRKRLGRV